MVGFVWQRYSSGMSLLHANSLLTSQPGGQDSQIITPDGSAKLETHYLLQTHDVPPAHIVVKTQGWRTGSPQIMKALADPAMADNVDPRLYSFRLFVTMETGDERYKDKINYGMWVGSGMRKDREIIYEYVFLVAVLFVLTI